jgi:toxin ParE1/3/4
MLEIQLATQADQDLKDIWRGLAEYRLELADKKIRRIVKKFELLSQFPLAGRERNEILPNLRSIPVDSLIILYQVIPKDGRTIVEIVRVTDGRRDLNRLFSDEDEEEEAP